MTPDQIWGENESHGRQADLFERREEAEQLIAYIESVAGRLSMREDKRAFTIAINAPYGEGKSFFLRRLAEHLSINHPVAYIDAWSDDLADEPLTALAATLKIALDPFGNSTEVQKRLARFMSKTGAVAKIVGWGLLRRGAGMAITSKAVDAAEEVLADVSDSVRDTLENGLKEAGNGSVDDAVAGTKRVNSQALMEARIATFEDGKQAIRNMKDSLTEIVEALEKDGSHNQSPIVIVIDELDRCRPTYAVKLLEEIKHLFDVPGIVFVLAIHSEQLGHSIAGAYGPGFDGRAYLKRFIDREYRLATPPLAPLLERLCEDADPTPFSGPLGIGVSRPLSR
jgi:Cdc6-like AAA superfamily ATPase